MVAEPSKTRVALILVALIAVVAMGAWWMHGRAQGAGEGEGESGELSAARDGAKADAGARDATRRGSSRALLGADKAVLSGTVRNSEGAGLAGAQVCAFADEGELLGAGDTDPRCTMSEADGHYRVEDLWPVKTSVSASAPSYKPGRWTDEDERVQLSLHAGRERSGVDITLEPGGVAVRGVVKDISGGVIEDAFVRTGPAWWGVSGTSVARTDAEGRFELWAAPESVRLIAWAEGYAEASTNALAPTELAALYLTPESVVSGTVIHAETQAPVPGVTVSVGGGFFSGNGGGTALSDDAGKFRISGIAPGTYEITLRADEFYGEGTEKVHLGFAESMEGLVVTAHPAFYVAGQVMLAGSETACESGWVKLKRDEVFGARANIDEEGQVLLRGLLPGTYAVELGCKDHVSEPEYADIVISDASLDGQRWEVRAGLAIRGIVVDGAGQPAIGVGVSAAAQLDADDPRAQQTSGWSAKTKADGIFELTGLLPGDYQLSVYAEQQPRLEDKTPVTLGESADVEGVRLELPASGRITGIVRDERNTAVAGVEVSARSIAGRWNSRRTRTGDDGRFEFSGLALGATRVQAQQGWAETLRAPGTTDDDVQGEVVDVLASEAVELELVIESHSAKISGRVVDSTGAPLSDAFVDASRMSDRAGAGASRSRSSLRWGWDRKPVLSDQDGAFELGELAEGDYILRAYRKGGGEAVIEGVATGSSGIELAIVDTGEIHGEVVLAAGGSPERFQLSLSDRAQGVWRNDSFFRTQGVFVVRELPPGNYELHITAAEGSAKTELILEADSSVDDLRLELEAKVALSGRLVDAETGAPVSGMKVTIAVAGTAMRIMQSGAKGSKEISDADGRFSVEGIDVGKLRMVIMPRNWNEDGDYGWTTRVLDIAAEPAVQDLGDVELIADRLDAKQRPGDLGFTLEDPRPDLEPEEREFIVALVRPGGPAAATELAADDVIVEVDGKSVRGLDSHRYEVLTRVPEGTELSLSTEGGKQVKLVVGPPRE